MIDLRDLFTRRSVGILVVSTAFVVGAYFFYTRPVLTMTVFDVGQGDAILLRCGLEDTLIDGGPDNTVLARLGNTLPSFDRTIERIILTHPHRDHYIGLIAILTRYRVKEFLYAESDRDNDPEYERLLAIAKENGVPLRRIAKGDRFAVGACATLETIWPPPVIPTPAIPAPYVIPAKDVSPRFRGAGTQKKTKSAFDPNEASIVLRLTRHGTTRALALLMGDATSDVEHELQSQKIDLSADVLKVGHHGSGYSTSSDFVTAVNPKIAVVSVGKKNRYGHPTFVALERLRRIGATLYRTDQNGDTRIIFPHVGPPTAHPTRSKK